MKTDIIAKKYAKALFSLFQGQDQLSILKTLQSFQQAFDCKPDLKQFFYLENVNKKTKLSLLEKCLKNKFLENFLMILIKKRRLNIFEKVVDKYKYMVFKSLSILEGELILAKNEDNCLKINFVKKLEDQYRQKIEWKEKIDPKLIGGAIVIVRNQLLDMSVKGRIKKIEDKLLSNQYIRE